MYRYLNIKVKKYGNVYKEKNNYNNKYKKKE